MNAWLKGLIGWLLACSLLIGVSARAQEIRTYYVTDGTGSPVVGTDANGNAAWTEDYLSYGERRVNASDSKGNPRWFTAAAQNRDTGLLYMGHRFMDPVQGRFVSIDRIGASTGDGSNFNRYWYAKDNPYAYVDPNGDSIFSIWDWYDFGRDNGSLIVNEAVFVAAKLLGNEGAAQIAVEEIEDGRANAALSTAGVVSVIPGTGRMLKAADRLANVAEDVKGGTYVLKNAEGVVMRTGRTNNLARRELEHARDPKLKDFTFAVVHRTDSYAEQRGLEQMLHDQYKPALNKIRPISPNNPRRGEYLDAAQKHLDRRGGSE